MAAYATKPVQQGQLDWLSFALHDDLSAPHPDLFEFELDNSFNGVDQTQLQILNVDFTADQYQFYRSDTSAQGPPSTITLSSESTYETLSNHSESLYGYPTSPTYSSMESVYSQDLQLGFAKFTVDPNTAPTTAPQTINPASASSLILDDGDSDSFGELPISPYDSITNSFEYDAAGVKPISPVDMYIPAQRVPPAAQPSHSISSTLAHVGIPHPIPRLVLNMSDPATPRSDASASDSRRKYPCPSCPRAFARAYNLKTHMATHDPNRPKPFACPHKSCGRSFSRKHDLGRHLISIHHADPEDKKIGVQASARTWCDSCGKGWNGSSTACGCDT